VGLQHQPVYNGCLQVRRSPMKTRICVSILFVCLLVLTPSVFSGTWTRSTSNNTFYLYRQVATETAIVFRGVSTTASIPRMNILHQSRSQRRSGVPIHGEVQVNVNMGASFRGLMPMNIRQGVTQGIRTGRVM
jgi:hypothetical protein